MKVRDLLTKFTKEDLDREILVASDEELNTLYTKFEVGVDSDTNELVIYGLSGSEKVTP